VTAVPLTFASSKRTLVNTVVLNFAQDGAIFGGGFTFGNILGYDKRSDEIWRDIVTEGPLHAPFRSQMSGEPPEVYAALQKQYKDGWPCRFRTCA